MASFTVLLFSIICKRKYCGVWLLTEKILCCLGCTGVITDKVFKVPFIKKMGVHSFRFDVFLQWLHYGPSVIAHDSSSSKRNPALFNRRTLKRILVHLGTFHDVLFKYSYQVSIFEFQFLAFATTQTVNLFRILPKAENLQLICKIPS